MKDLVKHFDELTYLNYKNLKIMHKPINIPKNINVYVKSSSKHLTLFSANSNKIILNNVKSDLYYGIRTKKIYTKNNKLYYLAGFYNSTFSDSNIRK